MKANIKLISEMTGFSPATVSNALNQKKGVSKDTAGRVFEAARRCGYLDNTRVTGVKLVLCRRSGQVVADTPFFTSLIEGVEAECRAHGLETALVNLDVLAPDYGERLAALLNDPSCGILLLATELEEADALPFREALAPVVVLDNWFEDTDLDSVLISNTDSVCKAVEYLIGLGHREIGYLAGALRIKNFFYREAGYLRALAKHGLAAMAAPRFELTPTMEGAFEDMARILAQSPALPTAFFADNDIIALGAMKALQQAGVRVPEDVSLIGFDDMPFCSIATPALTTIRVFKQEMGRAAVRRLMEIAKESGPVKTKTQICTEFVVRDSVRELVGR